METKTVAGVTYERNPKTGQYEPSNLPKDESASLIDYQVTMPDGETRSFRVAQKDAARFATQMKVLDAQLKAQAARQEDAQAHTSQENIRKQQFEAAITAAKMQYGVAMQQLKTATERQKYLEGIRQKETTSFIKEYRKAKGSDPSPAEVQAYLAQVLPQ